MTGLADKFARQNSGILFITALELKLLSTVVAFLWSSTWDQLGQKTETALLTEGLKLLVIVDKDLILVLCPLEALVVQLFHRHIFISIFFLIEIEVFKIEAIGHVIKVVEVDQSLIGLVVDTLSIVASPDLPGCSWSTPLIVGEDLVLDLSRWESKEDLYTKHIVLLQKLNELCNDGSQNLFQIKRVKVQLFFILGDSNFFIDPLHEGIVSLVLCHEVIKNTQRLDLEENPGLLCLVNNTLKESTAGLNQERILLVRLIMLENPDILLDDIVVHKHRELTDKVELSLDILLVRLITVLCC